MSQFKPGDVVQLKSGGPKMTVHHIHGDGDVTCDWFIGHEQRTGTFNHDALQLAEEKATRSQVRPVPYGGGPWS